MPIKLAQADLSGISAQAGISNTTQILFPRHANLQSRILNALAAGTAVSGIALGNSIVQGSGATGSNAWVTQLGSLLGTWAGAGTWTLTNYGIGGSNLGAISAFVAHNGESSADMISRGTVIATRPGYSVIMGLRNSTSLAGNRYLSLAEYRDVLRATLRQLIRAGIDPVFVTEPPQFTSGGDVEDTDANFGNWRKSALRICAEEGASVVDMWLYFYNLTLQGVNVKATYMADTVHPNDAGHTLIAQKVFELITSPAERRPFPASNFAENLRSNSILVSVYNATSGSTSAVSGAFGVSPRIAQAGGSHVAYQIIAGNSVQFVSSSPARGVIVLLYGGTATTATSIQVNYAAQGAASVGTISSIDPYERVTAYYLPISSSASAQWGKIANVALTAVGGTMSITGVIFLCDEQTENPGAWNVATETGTWSGTSLINGRAARLSNTVGDTAIVYWYGTTLAINHTTGSSFGKYSYSTDGGGSTTIDCYSASADGISGVTLEGFSEGWHATTFTVVTKNASASDNKVAIGRLRIWAQGGVYSARYLTAKAGTAIQLIERWESVRISKAASGSPTLPAFSADASSLTLGGTGSAILEVSKSVQPSQAPL